MQKLIIMRIRGRIGLISLLLHTDWGESETGWAQVAKSELRKTGVKIRELGESKQIL